MKIRKAIEALRSGKDIYRLEWMTEISEKHLKFEDEEIKYIDLVNESNVHVYPWIPDIEDLLADDWEISSENWEVPSENR